MASRLSKIDELTLPDHSFLDPGDACFYLGEYTARAGFAFSKTNDLIQNLKKPADRRGRQEWHYKERAIDAYGQELRRTVPTAWFRLVTFVPVPPSKTRDHPDHDDRLTRILRKVGEAIALDVRELVVMVESVEPAHLVNERRSPIGLYELMRIDNSLVDPSPQAICIFDDVLTTGAHFKAVEMHLRHRFPEAEIAGLFLARRAPGASAL